MCGSGTCIMAKRCRETRACLHVTLPFHLLILFLWHYYNEKGKITLVPLFLCYLHHLLLCYLEANPSLTFPPYCDASDEILHRCAAPEVGQHINSKTYSSSLKALHKWLETYSPSVTIWTYVSSYAALKQNIKPQSTVPAYLNRFNNPQHFQSVFFFKV